MHDGPVKFLPKHSESVAKSGKSNMALIPLLDGYQRVQEVHKGGFGRGPGWENSAKTLGTVF